MMMKYNLINYVSFRSRIYSFILEACICMGLIILSSLSAFCQPDNSFKIFIKMKENFDKIESYKCIYESFTTDGEEENRFTCKYFFKKPKLIRMEYIKADYPGSIMIYNIKRDKSKVALKVGSFIANFWKKLTFSGDFLDVDHKWVIDRRGHSIDHSDWGWFIEEHLKIKEVLGDNYGIYYERQETINGHPCRVFKLISKTPKLTQDIKKEIIWVDTLKYFPIRHIQFDSADTLVQSSDFRNIEFNIDLSDDLFIKF